MKKQIIAVDIDDVLSANAEGFIAFSNQRWATNLTVDDYNEHWASLWKVDHEETERRAKEFHESKVVGKYKHNDDAVDVLNKLKKHYELVITTSRRKELMKETLEWISRYFPDTFSEIHYAGMWDKIDDFSHMATKAELCLEIGANYLIDDQPKHCIAAAEAGIAAILFGDYTWNHGVTMTPGMIRLTNWHAVGEYFEREDKSA